MATLSVYISGAMTGLPDNNYPAFHAKATELRAKGYIVRNPAENFDGYYPAKVYVSKGGY